MQASICTIGTGVHTAAASLFQLGHALSTDCIEVESQRTLEQPEPPVYCPFS